MMNDKACYFSRTNEEGVKTYFFAVTSNYLDGHTATDKIRAKVKKLGLDTYFELFDDDGEKYYSGYMNLDLMNDNDMNEFTILDMATADSGCTEMKTRNKKTGCMDIV